MIPHHSLLLLNEFCLPEEQPPYYAAILDIVMMAFLAGLYRTPDLFPMIANAWYRYRTHSQSVAFVNGSCWVQD